MLKQFLIIALFSVHFISFAQDLKTTDSRKINDLSVSKDGTLHWKSVKEHNNIPYVIEQFRWNRWIKAGQVDAVGTPAENQYAFHPASYYGENVLRVKPFAAADSTSFKEIKWQSTSTQIKYTIQKKTMEILFSAETMYEINSASGELFRKGYGPSVTIEKLPKGDYILYYDNLTAKFKR